jgi:hypothetical protein
MKFLLLSALLLSTTPVFSADLFSMAQKKEVLQAIDGICGDTWCEGDYNFRFNKFSCDKATSSCELNFQFIKTDDKGENETFSAEQVCRFNNIKEFHQVMDSKFSLNEEFYSTLTDCIWEKEKAVHF